MKDSDFSEDTLKEVRKFIFDAFVNTSRAPVIEELINKFNIPRQQMVVLLHILEKKQWLVVQPSSNKILMLHPFSNITTSWIVKTDEGKSYYANCAWDSIAMHFSLHKDVDIESYCLYCNTKIMIRLENGKFIDKKPKSTFIVISKPASRWWDNIVDTCGNNMNYVCSEEHLQAWDNTVIELSKLLYSTKDQLDYKRPTDEEEIEMFKNLNLVGDFWESFKT